MTTHPCLLLAAVPQSGLRSCEEVRRSLAAGHPGALWNDLRNQAEADLRCAPYTPRTTLARRVAGQAAAANRDFHIVDATATRIKRAALAHLLSGEPCFRDEALRQLECVFDDRAWPDWRDLAHLQHRADLRTGQFLRAIGLAYDWLYPSLSPAQRQWVVTELDRRAIQPYLAALDARASWAFSPTPNNWMTCIVGGAGVAGMAFGGDHPASQRLVDEAIVRFRPYLEEIGPDGEFNESVGYAGAMQFPIEFFQLYGYWRGQPADELLDERLNRFCTWYLYCMLPPGVNAPLGDTHTGAPPRVTMFAAMAAATRNPVFQWFYEQYQSRAPLRDLCADLLTYDPSVPAASPAGRLPLGRGFKAHSAVWSSRTDWSPDVTACVVYGKGGHGSELHGHHDIGTVCLDGYAQPLIVDPGNLHYPADYFRAHRYQYYNAAAWGHNVPVAGGREMRTGKTYAADILAMAFDDACGAAWLADTTALYDRARRMRRGVIHLLPGIVAVLDRCEWLEDEELSLRWHTSTRAEPDAGGAFDVLNGPARLNAQLVVLNGGAPRFRRGEHAYQPPFDRDRLGNLLVQKNESYVELCLRTRAASLLTLFSVARSTAPTASWQRAGDGWSLATGNGLASVTASATEMVVACDGKTLRLNLDAGTASQG